MDPPQQALSEAEQLALQRRVLVVLSVSQVFAGVGFFIGLAVIALLSQELSGSAALSGMPPAIAVIGSALAAPPIAALMGRFGRRPGLVACYAIAALGSLVIVAAAGLGSFPGVCVGAFGFGLGSTAILLARYAGADLAPASRRGRAVSTVLMVTAVGALLGPNLSQGAATVADRLGGPALAGPFVISAVGFVIAALILAMFLRPDPLLVAQRLGKETDGGQDPGLGEVARGWTPLALVALATLVAINAAMIAIMTMTPIHLADGGGSLGVIGLVISLHLGAMFLPSPLTGWASDRYGRLPVIAAAAVVLCAAGALASIAAPDAFVLIAFALVLLGLGWNLGLVSASALLIDATPPAARPRAQGLSDLAMSFGGGGASLGSGLALQHSGYSSLGLAGVAIGVLLVLTAIAARRLPVIAPQT